MTYEYQQTQRYFAQIAGGMESLGATEIGELGAVEVSEVYRGLYFNADAATLYRINYCSRLLSRVIAPLANFQCQHTDQLYNVAKKINWADFFSLNQTFAIYANVSHSKIHHSKFAALRVKDGIADFFTEKFGKRPNVDTANPDVWINLHIERDRAVIGLDTSGGPLHKRGYRQISLAAPMQETLAAAIIRLSEWQGERPLFDPMCGAGTLLSEALMHYCRIPTGFLRKRFGFENLPDFDEKLWQEIKKETDARIRELPEKLISGSDLSPKAIAAAQKNLTNLPGGDGIVLSRKDFRDIYSLENSIIVCNPPYGIRLGEKEKLGAFYKQLGDFLKQRCQGSTAFIYFGEREFLKRIGLRPAWKKPLVNGALDGRLAKFELY